MKIFKIGMMVLAMLCMAGCGDIIENEIREAQKEKQEFSILLKETTNSYETAHRLRKMFAKEEVNTVKKSSKQGISGGFFLFIGTLNGGTNEQTEKTYLATYVRFAWETQNNIYVFSTLPLEKIRPKLVQKIGTPTVSFFLNKEKFEKKWWETDSYSSFHPYRSEIKKAVKNYNDPNFILANYLDYVIVIVEEKDWPQNINLPVNQNYVN